MNTTINLAGVDVSIDGVIERIDAITYQVSQDEIAHINYMELFIIAKLFPRLLQQSAETIFCCAQGDIRHTPKVSSSKIIEWLKHLELQGEVSDANIMSQITKQIFTLCFYLGSEEGFSADPRFSIEPKKDDPTPHRRRDAIIQEASSTQTTSDGSVIIEQKNGEKVKLKSKIGELGKKSKSDIQPSEVSTSKTNDVELKVNPRDAMRERLMRMNHPENDKTTHHATTHDEKAASAYQEKEEPTTTTASESTATRVDLEQCKSELSGNAEFWERYFSDAHAMYYDEIEERHYLSLASILSTSFYQVDPLELSAYFLANNKLIHTRVHELIQQLSTESSILKLGKYKDVAFHDKELGKRILLTLVEGFPDDLFLDTHKITIREGRILERYHIKTISKKSRAIDMFL